jgi:hypothetical protein
LTRFEDIPDDYHLQLAVENTAELLSQVRRLQVKLKILQTAITKIGLTDVDTVETAEGSYRYIPLSLDEFFQSIFDLENLLSQDPDYRHTDLPYRPCAFLEVGCGLGRNVFLLHATTRFHFDKIVGFDVVEAYVAAGRKYFGLGANLFIDDCLKFDYGGYDIIYFYRPFSDDAKQKQFEERLIETSKVGAYIIGSVSEFLDESPRLIRKDDGRRIWKRV